MTQDTSVTGMCQCGHEADAHTEESVFPVCEGASWPPERAQWAEGFQPLGHFVRPIMHGVEPCSCEGFVVA